MNTAGRSLLLTGGISNLAIAVLHIIIIFGGPPAYLFYGAGENMARMAAGGSLIPPIVTFILALVFAILGLYAVSGSGLIRKLPLLKSILYLTGIVYVVRGMLFITLMYGVRLDDAGADRDLVFSIVSLFIGVVYISGSLLQNNYLSQDK